jgi:hypothetical protein
MFNFEKLEVWQEAINFADLVYDVTRAFPETERFGLTNQLRRAAVSISSNLAEGSFTVIAGRILRVSLRLQRVHYSRSFPRQTFHNGRDFWPRLISTGYIPSAKSKARC